MSDESDGVADDSADVAVAKALAQAVREGGRQLSSEPRRVQGMVNDVLGAESRTRRAEVDAVVLAAEESIPDDLLSGRIDVDEALERLHGRGLDGGVALFAVDVWRYALGMFGDDSVPPSLTNSLEATSQPAPTDPMPMSVTAPDPLEVGLTERGPEASGVAGSEPVSAAEADDRDVLAGHGRSKVWWLVGSAAALIGLLAVALVVVAGGRNGSDASEAKTPTTTTTLVTTSTIRPTAAAVDFDSEVTPVGNLERSWEVVDDKVDATLTFANASGTATSGTFFEVIPTSMAANSTSITSPLEFTVMRDVAPQGFKRAEEPLTDYVVLAWILSVEPGATADVSYSVAVPTDSDLTADTLEGWKADQIAAQAEFAVERDTPPALTVTTPNGTVFQSQTVQITGTTDPTATLTLGGNPVAAVNPDGTWTMTGDLPPGPSTLDFVATSKYGTAATASVTVTIELPAGTVVITSPTPPTTPPPTTAPRAPTAPGAPTAPTTTAPPTTAPPTTAPPTTAPPTTAPPTTAPPTTAPPTTAPPPIAVAISGPDVATLCDSYTYFMGTSGFNPVSIRWSPIAYTGTSYSVQFTGSTGVASISVTATAPDGRTASATKRVTVQPPLPGSPGC